MNLVDDLSSCSLHIIDNFVFLGWPRSLTIVIKGKELTHHGANKKLEKPSAQGMAAEKESYSEFVQKCLSTANTGTSLLGTKVVFSELPLDTFILKVYF